MARIGLIVILLIIWILVYNFFDYGLAAATWDMAKPVVVPIAEALTSAFWFAWELIVWTFHGSAGAAVWCAIWM